MTLQVGIRSTGSAPVCGSVPLYADGWLGSSRLWELPPLEATYLTWGHPPLGQRWFEARLSGVGATENTIDHDRA